MHRFVYSSRIGNKIEKYDMDDNFTEEIGKELKAINKYKNCERNYSLSCMFVPKISVIIERIVPRDAFNLS